MKSVVAPEFNSREGTSVRVTDGGSHSRTFCAVRRAGFNGGKESAGEEVESKFGTRGE